MRLNSPDIPDPIVDISHAKVFRGSHPVFEDLTLQIHSGEHVAILGPNGAGKTTLLKLLTRELSPVVRKNSYIRLFGKERFTLWQLRESIGVVSQEFQNQYQALATGFDVVMSAFFGSVGMHGHHHPSEEQKARVEESLKHFGLCALRDKQYLQLSTGQQRRLLLARAMIHKPRALILDEPTNSLDVKAAFQMLEDMQKLAAQGTTLILVTHHVQEIIPEIKRIVLLDQGKIAADGEKPNTLTSRTLSQLFDTPLTVTQQNGYHNWTPTP